MIRSIRLRNFKCFENTGEIRLGRFNVFIGNNDSGKTSVLQALELLAALSDKPFSRIPDIQGERFLSFVRNSDPNCKVGFDIGIDDASAPEPLSKWWYGLSLACDASGYSAFVDYERFLTLNDQVRYEYPVDGKLSVVGFDESKPGSNLATMKSNYRAHDCTALHRFQDFRISEPELVRLKGLLSDFSMFRFDPRRLRESSPASTDSDRLNMDSDGFGLPTVLAGLSLEGDVRSDIIKSLRETIPSIQQAPIDHVKMTSWKTPEPSILTIASSPFGEHDPELTKPMQVNEIWYRLRFKLTGQEKILSADMISDGTLYYLAFLTLLHLPNKPKLLAIEEPENGVHPSRLKEVISLLRRLSDPEKTPNAPQIIITTHSPYVLDLVEPEEVTVFERKGDESPRVTSLRDGNNFDELKDVYKLGEYWSYVGEEGLRKLSRPTQVKNE